MIHNKDEDPTTCSSSPVLVSSSDGGSSPSSDVLPFDTQQNRETSQKRFEELIETQWSRDKAGVDPQIDNLGKEFVLF